MGETHSIQVNMVAHLRYLFLSGSSKCARKFNWRPVSERKKASICSHFDVKSCQDTTLKSRVFDTIMDSEGIAFI